jgi:hypothetical protein
VRAALKPSDRRLGGGAEDSVNGSLVDTPATKADLERGDLGISLGTSLPRQQERGCDKREAESERAEDHGPAIQPYVLFARLVPPANG